MPPYKYVFNRVLTLIENVLTGTNLSEWHTGFRAYSRRVLMTVPWEQNSDDFVFDSQMLLQCVALGFRIGEIPVPVRYYDDSSSISFRRSITYGTRTLLAVGRFLLHRSHLAPGAQFRAKGGGGLQHTTNA
jgi:hypothetical protein